MDGISNANQIDPDFFPPTGSSVPLAILTSFLTAVFLESHQTLQECARPSQLPNNAGPIRNAVKHWGDVR